VTLETLIAMRPSYAPARVLRGTALAMLGRLEESVTELQSAVELGADQEGVHTELAKSLWELGRYAEAVESFGEAARRNPQSPDVARELAWALATCPRAELRDGAQALDIARRLCEGSRYTNPIYLDALAAAQAETGSFTDAVESIERGIEIVEQRIASLGAGAAGRGALEEFAAELRARRGLYQRGSPYREG
jgi:tetratricopeptide (TPR) repeat protein